MAAYDLLAPTTSSWVFLLPIGSLRHTMWRLSGNQYWCPPPRPLLPVAKVLMPAGFVTSLTARPISSPTVCCHIRRSPLRASWQPPSASILATKRRTGTSGGGSNCPLCAAPASALWVGAVVRAPSPIKTTSALSAARKRKASLINSNSLQTT